MLVLDSVQILAAVERSLQTHVLPRLEDDFARVQIASAVRALQEVSDRLERGDPCEQMNAELEAGAREIARSARETSPAFAQQLDSALDSIPTEGNARERNRQLGESLWRLVSRNDDPAARELLELIRTQAIQRAGDDAAYICGEAVASLT